jgi:hypothetical protein
LFVVRVPRDDKYIGTMEVEVVEFLTEVEGMVNQLKERK